VQRRVTATNVHLSPGLAPFPHPHSPWGLSARRKPSPVARAAERRKRMSRTARSDVGVADSKLAEKPHVFDAEAMDSET
jgi:hypothetical protein